MPSLQKNPKAGCMKGRLIEESNAILLLSLSYMPREDFDYPLQNAISDCSNYPAPIKIYLSGLDLVGNMMLL